jgi:signal transduction histidine kinase
VQQLLLLAEVSEPQNFRLDWVDPRPTIQEVYDYMARVAERHSVFLGLLIAPDVRLWDADRGALFTLLKNLLENAIQHSPPGGVVTLTVSPAGFSIVDQGPGVSAADLPRMFDRFWRSAERREEGAGLGLAICREIASAHDWDLQARRRDQGLEVYAVMKGRSDAVRPAGDHASVVGGLA